ncbi:MAG: alpha/beta hydrolase [Flavobacteriaceae bacterium]|nr:alpha/beta hydrolase [Flavobacteriaceae bacterium]
MNKTHIYCVPGLSASSKIFEHLKLPESEFEIHHIEWLIPESINETMEHYAKRMCESITEKNMVLIGVSFGGIMVQEMNKFVHPKKIILISSVKNTSELPKRLRLAKLSKVYKLFPAKNLTSIENFISYAFGNMTKKRIEQYKIYLSVRNELYLRWSMYNVLHWKQKETLPNLIHIHGTSDHIFPIKYIKNCIEVKNGAHVMILAKAKKISAIIVDALRKG